MNELCTEQTLDVRPLPPRQRHSTIFDTWKSLPKEDVLLLVNDHDPLPLYYQFACEHRGEFHWDYLEQGPEVWRVRLRKGDFADPGFKPAPRMAAPCCSLKETTGPVELDVRPIFERGETPCVAIDDAAAAVAPGQSLILIAPFEPVPLYAKLGRDGFSHESKQMTDGSWRIEFRKS
jgi:uncharacterized protein (DUF2249 family)